MTQGSWEPDAFGVQTPATLKFSEATAGHAPASVAPTSAAAPESAAASVGGPASATDTGSSPTQAPSSDATTRASVGRKKGIGAVR
jgi:hypothetical protein